MKRLALCLVILASAASCSAVSQKRGIASAPKTPYTWHCDKSLALHLVIEKKSYPKLVFTGKNGLEEHQVDFPVAQFLGEKTYDQLNGLGAVGMDGLAIFAFKKTGDAISIEVQKLDGGGKVFLDNCKAQF